MDVSGSLQVCEADGARNRTAEGPEGQELEMTLASILTFLTPVATSGGRG